MSMGEIQVGRGLGALFRPRAIAIFGASDDVTKIGGRPVQFLQKYGFAGGIFPINRKGGTVQSLTAFATLADCPQVPDLAVIAVPPEAALQAVRDCAERGVGAAVILSSGFSEMGDAGQRLQDAIGCVARDSGMRVVGPNCLGSVGVPEKSIATFSVALEAAFPSPGAVGIVSQSGNLGSYTMRMAVERGMGISRLLTTGNECDVDVADGIAALVQDPDTRVILCCMETCRHAPRFRQALAMARAASKAVVVLKVGVSEAGRAAAASHTGALAGSDAVFDAVLRRAGTLRVASIEQLIEVGQALSVTGSDRLPPGPRTAVVTASGGFGVLLADAASGHGLELPTLSSVTQARITEAVPYASPVNPVDMTAQVSSRPELLAEVLSAVAADPGCDAIILQSAYAFQMPRLRDTYLAALARVRDEHPRKTLLVCCRAPLETAARLHALGFPTVESIDAACATLAALVRHAVSPAVADEVWEPGDVPPLGPQAFASEAGAKAALAQAGLPVLPECLATTRAEALAAAQSVGYPVVLKIVSPDIPHKTEVGGVVVGLDSDTQLSEAHDALLARVAARAPHARIMGVLVAPLVRGGTELILGAKHDPVFGPVVMVGLGGIHAEVFQDVALQPAPVSDDQAVGMLRSLRSFPLLDGARGRPRADVAAAAQAVAALSRFALQHAGQVAEIDINPLVVLDAGRGAVALDALLVPHASPNTPKADT